MMELDRTCNNVMLCSLPPQLSFIGREYLPTTETNEGAIIAGIAPK